MSAPRDEVKQACTVLYDRLPPLDAEVTREGLEPLVGPCDVEWADPTTNLPVAAGVAQFGPHKVAMLALAAPVKEDILVRTVGVSPMPEEERAMLLGHRATVRLLYVGSASDPLEQLTALYAVAWVMVAQDGLGILNERAALAQPSQLLAEYLPQLGSTPPPLGLWVGVVTFLRDAEGSSRRYLMRTYGMEQFGKPELAMYMRDRADADAVYHTLLNICLYIIESGPSLQLTSGHTAEFRAHTYLFTEPAAGDAQLQSPTGLLLLMEV